MKRSIKVLLPLIGAATLVLSACGDDDDSASNTVANAATTTPAGTTAAGGTATGTAAGSTTVLVAQIQGVGSVLTDSDGMVLYMNEEEAKDSSVLCDKSCAEEWPPLTVTGTPTGPAGVTGLATADRPDGSSQVTYNGHRLYTFKDDASPGQAHGDGASDNFDGQAFNWHAATTTADGAAGGTATTMAGGTQPAGTASATTSGY
jgi:predicted lipoprotein with Yx(FWY)xxD motif